MPEMTRRTSQHGSACLGGPWFGGGGHGRRRRPPSGSSLSFFRIGTGSTGGTYFPIGGLIANIISNPPGSRSCEKGGSCGVPGLIAVAQSTEGSVHNVDAIAVGEIESGLSQSDVAYWAYTGTGVYGQRGPVTQLRLIANLYPESLQIVVRRDSDIAAIGGRPARQAGIAGGARIGHPGRRPDRAPRLWADRKGHRSPPICGRGRPAT